MLSFAPSRYAGIIWIKASSLRIFSKKWWFKLLAKNWAMGSKRAERVVFSLASMGAPKATSMHQDFCVFSFKQFLPYKVLLGIILLLGWTTNVNLDPRFTMVEYFAGKKHVSGVFRDDPSHRVASFELKDSPSMDFLSCGGFMYLISTLSEIHVPIKFSNFILFPCPDTEVVLGLSTAELSWSPTPHGSSLQFLD